jgi:uroporphyrin-III C-methyltransferase
VQADVREFADHPADWMRWAVGILSIAIVSAGWLAWNSQQKLESLQRELVRRQSDSQTQSAEARILAKEAQEQAREAAARATLLETRLTEVAMQRSQVEELIKTLSASRDENLLADIEAGLRVATQQAALTGGAEPLVAALQSADDRLARSRQPRLDNVRRAVAKDLDRVKATRVADLNSLAIRLDEATRLVDEVALLNQPEVTAASTARAPTEPARAATSTPPSGKAKSSQASPSAASAAEAASQAMGTWSGQVLDWTRGAAIAVWNETRGLIRLTRINRPEGMLISPDQGFFLRENIKLRLLNARVALLSRQNALAQADLQNILATLPRYFDMQSRKTQLLQGMLQDVSVQCQLTAVPRPDDTLAALATMTGGR